MQAVKDSSALYEVGAPARHAERPGFRINRAADLAEAAGAVALFHTNIQDTFYVLEGEVRLFLREPKEDVRLRPARPTACAPAGRHLSPTPAELGHVSRSAGHRRVRLRPADVRPDAPSARSQRSVRRNARMSAAVLGLFERGEVPPAFMSVQRRRSVV